MTTLLWPLTPEAAIGQTHDRESRKDLKLAEETITIGMATLQNRDRENTCMPNMLLLRLKKKPQTHLSRCHYLTR